jgi:catecholate siderophore receptor
MSNSTSATSSSLLGGVLAALVLPAALVPMAPAHAEAEAADDQTIIVRGHLDGDANPNAAAGAPYKVDKSQNDKLTEKLRDTPKTVTAIPKEVIEDLGATSFREVVRSTPGVTLGTGEGGNAFGDRVFIRGFEARNDVYIDGMRDPGVTSREIFGVEQIEVIKGPSGAFGGRGTTGGLVSLESKRPNLAQNFLTADVGVGTDNYRRATLDGNVRLSDTFGLRANVMYQNADTAGRDYATNERYGGSLAAEWHPTDNLWIKADYYGLRSHGVPDFGVPFDSTTQAPYQVDRNNFYGVVGRDFIRSGADVGTFRVDWSPVEGLDLASTTRLGRTYNRYLVGVPGAVCKFARTSTGACPTTGTDVGVANYTVSAGAQRRWADNKYVAQQTSATARFDTGGISHTVVLGGEYSHEKVSNSAITIPASVEDAKGNVVSTSSYVWNLLNPNPVLGYTVAVGPDTTTGPSVVTIDSLAGYVIDTIKFTPKLWFTGGARFDSYDLSYQSSSLATATRLKSVSDFWNWQASLTWKPAEPVTLYASWATSANPSGEQLDGNGVSYDGISAATANLEPERNKSWEAGAKWETADGKMLLTGAVYRIDKDNARENVGSGVYELVGKLRSQGFEVSATGTVGPLQLFGGYTYTDAKIIASATAANVGRRFANIPLHSANLLATWRFTDRFEAGGQAHWQSTVYGGSSVAGSAHIPAYARFDLVSRYQLTENVEARLNVNNVTNKTYYDAIYRSTSPFAYVAPGRSAMMTFEIKY